MEISIFGKDDCVKCEETKKAITTVLSDGSLADKVPLNYFDMESVDGMAEGAFNDVLKIPTVIITKSGNKIRRWDGDVPATAEVVKLLES